ncbi:MAG TPA: hypothetical protein VLV88_14580 [Terriglobales bacterium]|nr:hypothetical protein [Terriglobales bacterium]
MPCFSALAQSSLDFNGGQREALDGPSSAAAAPESPEVLSNSSIASSEIRYPRFSDFPINSSLDILRRRDTGTNATYFIRPVETPPSRTSVHWGPALRESLLYTGIMHTFNIWTEPGTRDTLNGHWFQNYIDSVSELRGWSDSDTFMAPYVGHPLEGSIFGYIFRQNDPKYVYVQWGDGRIYFISVLRSMAWSAVWHTQWKIGPISEASIGNVMLHASPGFITLVDTPTLGAVTMMAEDAADRYLIMGLENRTSNRMVIILARSFLNPGRSFANLMAFQLPWRRPTRLGLSGNDFEIRKELVADYRNGSGEKPFVYVRKSSDSAAVQFVHTYPKEAPIELSAYPYYENFLGGGNCIGGGGSGAARLSPSVQIVAEVNGCLVMHFPADNQSGDSLFYGVGPRWTPRASHRLSPYAGFLFGGRKVTYEVDNDSLREELLKEWNNGDGALSHYPKRSDWSAETSSNGVSVAAGAGVDVVITRPFAWRIIDLQYTHSWMGDVNMIHPQNGIRITTEAVLRIGTW